ncbi:MAG: hypothetical protein D6812_18055, partial [Deltaproteobacteria bacterium]
MEGGWILLDNRLYWSDAEGRAWREITPSDLGAATIRGVSFLDSRQGWMVLTEMTGEGEISYLLGRTSDGGQTWAITPLDLFSPHDPAALAGGIFLGFRDREMGWIVVKRATSSNFSVGALFTTTDGGERWQRRTLPIGAPVVFLAEGRGWTAGGAAGNELYRTLDRGERWERVTLAAPEEEVERAFLPRFDARGKGLLALITHRQGKRFLTLFETDDFGDSWERQRDLGLDGGERGEVLPLALIPGEGWLLVDPTRPRRFVGRQGKVTSRPITQSFPGSIVTLDMVTLEIGWAVAFDGA